GGDDPSAVLMAQDLAIDHLLVDEFQDTSKRQLELLARLTAGWVPGDGRTLFVVGDPMQSIYAFREADVGHYLEAARQGRIGEVRVSPLALCANFRSEPGLVDCVNALFPRVLEGGATRTAAAVAVGAAGAARERLDAPHGDAVTFEWAEDAAGEAARVVARVAAALAEGHASIGVLLRRRKDAEPILAALAHADIACEAIRLDALVERPISRDLLWLARALTQPADRLAWLTVLRAPFCGIALGDLFTIASAGNRRPRRCGRARAFARGRGPVATAARCVDGAGRRARRAARPPRARAVDGAGRSRRVRRGRRQPRRGGGDARARRRARSRRRHRRLRCAVRRGRGAAGRRAPARRCARASADGARRQGPRVRRRGAARPRARDAEGRREAVALADAHARSRAPDRHAARPRGRRPGPDRRMARRARRRRCARGSCSPPVRRLHAREGAAAFDRGRPHRRRPEDACTHVARAVRWLAAGDALAAACRRRTAAARRRGGRHEPRRGADDFAATAAAPAGRSCATADAGGPRRGV